MYWLVGFLAQYPEYQRRCYEEVVDAFGCDGIPTLAKRSSLPFLDAFIHETMRVGVVVPSNVRRVRCDTRLGGYFIPKGTTLMINTYSFHYDPKHFDDPHKFDPTRLLSASGELCPHKKGFMPFGAGARVCLGEMIAKKTTFMLACLLIQKYQLLWPENQANMDYAGGENKFLGVPAEYKVTLQKR